jgi:fructose-specific phosphotransferase system IIC component
MKPKIKQKIVDGIASVTFSFCIASPIELLILKLSMQEWYIVRANAVAIGFFFGIGFGYISNLMKKQREKSKLVKFLIDTVLYTVLASLLYTALIYIVNKHPETAIRSLWLGIILNIISGGPYGWWQDYLRKVLQGTWWFHQCSILGATRVF